MPSLLKIKELSNSEESINLILTIIIIIKLQNLNEILRKMHRCILSLLHAGSNKSNCL